MSIQQKRELISRFCVKISTKLSKNFHGNYYNRNVIVT